MSPHVRDVHANPIGITAVVYHRINFRNATFDVIVNRIGAHPTPVPAGCRINSHLAHRRGLIPKSQRACTASRKRRLDSSNVIKDSSPFSTRRRRSANTSACHAGGSNPAEVASDDQSNSIVCIFSDTDMCFICSITAGISNPFLDCFAAFSVNRDRTHPHRCSHCLAAARYRSADTRKNV